MNQMPQSKTIKALRVFGRSFLQASTLESNAALDVVALEVDLLLGKVLRLDPIGLHINADRLVGDEDVQLFEQMLRRRLVGEPIAYILEKREFWGLSFYVTPAVLIPRPETELVVSRALNYFHKGQVTLVDVGVGSGAIILSILDELRAREGEKFLQNVCAVGIDTSDQALEVCAVNAARLGLRDVLTLSHSSLLEALPSLQKFKRLVVVSNPPYVPSVEQLPPDVGEFEPHGALFAGADGLDVFRQFAAQLQPYFAEGAVFIAEHGKGQEVEIAGLLRENGASSVEYFADLAGINRVVEAR